LKNCRALKRVKTKSIWKPLTASVNFFKMLGPKLCQPLLVSKNLMQISVNATLS